MRIHARSRVKQSKVSQRAVSQSTASLNSFFERLLAHSLECFFDRAASANSLLDRLSRSEACLNSSFERPFRSRLEQPFRVHCSHGAGQSSHFERHCGHGDGPSSHFERYWGHRAGPSSHFERHRGTGGSEAAFSLVCSVFSSAKERRS